MDVTVRLFASFREATGENQQIMSLEPGATVGEVWERLVAHHPRLAPWKNVAGMALNGRYTGPDTPLSNGDVIAFLPPVSGG